MAIERVRINNQITAPELQVVDDEGSLGVLSREEALNIAKERELDLIEIAPTARPPVAKIMEYGKFLYQKQKKQKDVKKVGSETRIIKVKMGTSDHDLQLKAKKVSEFLADKNRVRIDMVLRGRSKYMDKNFIEERSKRILGFITEPYKVSGTPLKSPSGISIIVEHTK